MLFARNNKHAHFIIGATGPNISSCDMTMLDCIPVSTVG